DADLRLGQDVESNRLRLKIVSRIVSVSDADDVRLTVPMKIRDRLHQLEHELQLVQSTLEGLWEGVAKSPLGDQQVQDLRGVDQRLATVDQIIANLRNESKDTQFAFVGLQMVEIGNAYITP